MMPGMGNREDLAEILGRCRTQTGCQFQTTDGNQLDQLPTQLMLLAGVALSGRIEEPGAWLPDVWKQKSNAEIMAEMYCRTLCRQPTDLEANFWHQAIGNEKTRKEQEKLADLFWSLLTSREFATNH